MTLSVACDLGYFRFLYTSLPIQPSSHYAMRQWVGLSQMIVKHVECHVTKHNPDSWKENTLSLLTGLGKGYCCVLLPQVRPDGKVLSSQIMFCTHTTRFANVLVE